MRYAMDQSEHARIFGAVERPEAPGAYRLCRTCGGWHLRGNVPHNCRPPAPPRNPDLAAPRVAPAFDPFMTGKTDVAEYIGDRRAKREYMERHGLVEYDEGIRLPDEHWTAPYEHERAVVADLKRFAETDPLAIPPDLRPERLDEAGCLDEGTEIDTDTIEIADDMR